MEPALDRSGDARQRSREHPTGRAAWVRTREQEQPGAIHQQIRRSLDQCIGIRRTPERRARHCYEKGLPAKLVEVETLLPAVLPLVRASQSPCHSGRPAAVFHATQSDRAPAAAAPVHNAPDTMPGMRHAPITPAALPRRGTTLGLQLLGTCKFKDLHASLSACSHRGTDMTGMPPAARSGLDASQARDAATAKLRRTTCWWSRTVLSSLLLLAYTPGPQPRTALAATALVAAEHHLAAAAGVEVLEQGGNAVDAAIAAAAAAGTVNPISCGLGGGGFMLIYEAGAGRAHALDYREVAPAAATVARFLERGVQRITTGPLAVAVPGEPAGLAAAHARFGVLPLRTVLAPAIRSARHGFLIEAHLAAGIAKHRELLRAEPALARIFLHPDGSPRRRGEHLVQADLAASLELLAEHAAAFYRGPTGAAIATTLADRGGLMTPEDLAAYRVRWRTPLRGHYRGRTILTMPPPGSGGVLLEALNVLSAYDIGALELGSPTYFHLLADTLKAVFADRARYYGDPEFADVPVARLISPTHAATIRQRLSAIRVLDMSGTVPADAGTSHISVVDTAGNAVAVTTTINTAFGSGLVARGTGIILNNEMADFSLQPGAANVFGLVATAANVVAPRKRPLSSMSPTIVLRKGRPEIVIGASGGPTIITATLQTLLALIDFHLPVTAAVATPRIHHQGLPNVLLIEEPGVPHLTRRILARLGHKVRTTDSLGAVSVIHIGPNGAAGVGAPRKGGAASPVARAAEDSGTMRAGVVRNWLLGDRRSGQQRRHSLGTPTRY
jgi:gamma-glutamyltranspeptidase/glutathione hydrolase